MNTSINNPRQAFEAVRTILERQEQETAVAVYINNSNRIVATRIISIGTDTQTVFPIKFICKYAILNNATGVIVAHNHPSGNPQPSTADIQQTETLRKALKMFEISLTDHIIVGDDRFYSFNDESETKF